MIRFLNKLWRNRWMLRSLPQTVWFNFHYLPFRQAIRLPIMLYKPKLLSCKGSVVITAKEIKTGMIRLGVNVVSLYPNAGIVFECMGGAIEFKGMCNIGNNSAISVGTTGHIVFGNVFGASTSLRITSYCSIEFGRNVRVGWECLVMDTDFHKMTKVEGGYSRGYGSITVGKNCWIGARTIVLKNTHIPDYCVVFAQSLLNKKYDVPSYSVIGSSSEVIVKAQGKWRNTEDDVIDFSKGASV